MGFSQTAEQRLNRSVGSICRPGTASLYQNVNGQSGIACRCVKPAFSPAKVVLGKVSSILMKNVAHVVGKDWLNSLPEPGPAFYVGAEDDVDELHIRLAWISTDWNPSNAGFGKGLEQLRISALSVIRYGELITRVHAVSFASATILGELGTPRFRCIDLRRMPASWRSQVSWFNSRLTPDMANDTAHMCLSDHYMN